MSKHVLTREDALKRLAAAKAKKRQKVSQLEIEMKETYERQTGLKANYFVVL